MKTLQKVIALSIAFIVLMTSCYTSKVALPENNMEEIQQYITNLESGDRIRISTYENEKLSKISIQFLAADEKIIKGLDMDLSSDQRISNIRTIEIGQIQKIEIVDTGKSVFAMIGGLLGLLTIIAAIDIAVNGLNIYAF